MDFRIRELEKKLSISPDIELGVHLLRHRLSARNISMGDIRAAASLGSNPCIAYLGGQRPDFSSLSMRAYILVGFAATQHPDIQQACLNLLIDGQELPFFAQCDRVFMAYISNQSHIELEGYRVPLRIKEAAQALITSARLGYPIYTDYLRDSSPNSRWMLDEILQAYRYLLSALKKNPRDRSHSCILSLLPNFYRIRTGESLPHRFDIGPAAHLALEAEWTNILTEEISPDVIDSLVGPYLSF